MRGRDSKGEWRKDFSPFNLDVGGGKTFTMTARNLSEKNKYVKSVKLNGKEIDGFILTAPR